MDGILIIDKEKDMTSRDVVNIVSKKLKTKKVGHAGTLDPLATGVLVICTGKYTKLIEVLTNHDKVYEFEACLGVLTETLDTEGKIIKSEDTIISSEVLIDAINKFPKSYIQEVPIYSAVRVNGKKLYEYARNNEEVILPKRKVLIKEFTYLDSYVKDNKTYLKARVLVSKGTYIRSLILDYAKSLGKIGIMVELRRIKQGDFKIEDSIKLDDNYNLITDLSFLPYKKVEVDENIYSIIKNGGFIDYNGDDIVLLIYKNNYIAIYKRYEKDLTKMKPWKMFI